MSNRSDRNDESQSPIFTQVSGLSAVLEEVPGWEEARLSDIRSVRDLLSLRRDEKVSQLEEETDGIPLLVAGRVTLAGGKYVSDYR